MATRYYVLAAAPYLDGWHLKGCFAVKNATARESIRRYNTCENIQEVIGERCNRHHRKESTASYQILDAWPSEKNPCSVGSHFLFYSFVVILFSPPISVIFLLFAFQYWRLLRLRPLPIHCLMLHIEIRLSIRCLMRSNTDHLSDFYDHTFWGLNYGCGL